MGSPSFTTLLKELTLSDLATLTPEWSALCERARSEPFHTPAWVLAALQTSSEKKLTALSVHRGGELVGFLPMRSSVRDPRRLLCRTIRGAATFHSMRFDFVCARDSECDGVVSSAWRTLAQSDWDVLEFSDVPEGAALEPLAYAARADGFHVLRQPILRAVYIPLSNYDPTLEYGVPGISGQFRRDLRRYSQRAADSYAVSLDFIDRADRTALDAFYQLEHSGWKGRNNSSILSKPHSKVFFDAIAIAGERAGFLSLYFLRFDDQLVAAHFGVTHNGRYFATKIAFAEQFAAFAPGQLIVNGILKHCRPRGVALFDFIGDAEQWQRKWSKQIRAHHTWLIVRPSLLGQAFLRSLDAFRADGYISVDSADGPLAGWSAVPTAEDAKDGIRPV